MRSTASRTSRCSAGPTAAYRVRRHSQQGVEIPPPLAHPAPPTTSFTMVQMRETPAIRHRRGVGGSWFSACHRNPAHADLEARKVTPPAPRCVPASRPTERGISSRTSPLLQTGANPTCASGGAPSDPHPQEPIIGCFGREHVRAVSSATAVGGLPTDCAAAPISSWP